MSAIQLPCYTAASLQESDCRIVSRKKSAYRATSLQDLSYRNACSFKSLATLLRLFMSPSTNLLSLRSSVAVFYIPPEVCYSAASLQECNLLVLHPS